MFHPEKNHSGWSAAQNTPGHIFLVPPCRPWRPPMTHCLQQRFPATVVRFGGAYVPMFLSVSLFRSSCQYILDYVSRAFHRFTARCDMMKPTTTNLRGIFVGLRKEKEPPSRGIYAQLSTFLSLSRFIQQQGQRGGGTERSGEAEGVELLQVALTWTTPHLDRSHLVQAARSRKVR